MNYSITDDKFDGVEQVATDNKGGAFKKLRFLVMHYTAGTSIDGTIRHFKNPASQVSAHLVIGRDGRIVQLVPFDTVAWHAGRDSEWKPSAGGLLVKRLNFFSIGIELVNAGPFSRAQDGRFYSWSGKLIEPADVVEVDPAAKGSFGKRFWHRYPEEQLEVALQAAQALVTEYRLEEVLGHSDIAPGRKTDPGPAFPMNSFRSALYGRA